MSIELLKDLPGTHLLDEPLSRHTWYRVGGPADLLYSPANVNALTEALKRCRDAAVPVLVLGKGANVLVADQGYRGVVLRLDLCCSAIEAEGTQLTCGSGAELGTAVLRAETDGLSGLADLAGIPGTIGGALRMNAGAFGSEIGDQVGWVEGLDHDQQLVRRLRDEIGFGYRNARGLEPLVLLRCSLDLQPGDRAALAERRAEILELRAGKQPLACPSCGSVFKRPHGDYAGRLVETAGCKGLRRGGAVVSEKHANFILNDDSATSADIRALITEVRRRVKEHSGVGLQPEVIPVGFDWDW